MNLRTGIRRLLAAPREALEWLRHPDQALVRIEARWVFRWFSRFPGLAWLGAYVCVVFILLNRDVLYPALTGKPFPSRLPTTLLYAIPKLGFWLFFIRRRIEGFFRDDRLEQLVVTPCTGAMLWPALCFAPGLGVSMLLLADMTLFSLDIQLEVFASQGLDFNSEIRPLEWLASGMLELILAPAILALVFLYFSAIAWAVTTHAVAQAAPRLTALNLLRHALVGYFVIILPAAILPALPYLVFFALAGVSDLDPAPFMILTFVLLPVGPLIVLYLVRRELRHKILDLRHRMSPEKLWHDRQAALDARHRERDARTGES